MERGWRPCNLSSLQDVLAGLVVEAAKRQHVHGRAAACERPQFGGPLAAGEQQTASMVPLTQDAEQFAILAIARSVGARRGVGLHDRLEIIEDQQAASLAQHLHQPGKLVAELLRRGGSLVGDRADGLVEHLRERRAVAQRAEQHHLKLGQHLLGKGDRQACLADPAKPEDDNHPAVLIHQPVPQRSELALSPVKRRNGDRLAPFNDRSLSCGLSARMRKRAAMLTGQGRRGQSLGQQPREPGAVEGGEPLRRVLVNQPPELCRFFQLLAGSEHAAHKEDRQQTLQRLCLRIRLTALPLLQAASMDADLLGKFALGQRSTGAEGQELLTKRIVSLAIDTMRSGR